MRSTKSASIFRDVHPRLLICAITQSLLSGATFFGVTVLNVPEPFFKEFLRETVERRHGAVVSDTTLYWLWTSLVAATTAGPLVGSFLLGFLATKFGRRDMVMVWNNLFLLVSCAMQSIAFPLKSYECLLAGRLITGVCIGMWSFVPVYLAECSPDSCRGLIAMLVGVGRTFWMLMGAIFGLPSILGTKTLLPYLLLVPVVPAILHICLTPLFANSPKFLYISENNRVEAAKAVRFYHGCDAELPQILLEYTREAELTKHKSSNENNNATFSEILRTPHLRWPLIICIVAVIAVDCSGTDITNQYSNGLLKTFGLGAGSATMGTIISLVPPFMLSLVAPFVVEFFGRRKIVLFGICSGVFSVTVLFITGFINEPSWKNVFPIVGVAASYVGVYLGFGPMTGILPGEIAPEGSRSMTAAISSFFTWFVSFVILMVFPTVDDRIGSYSYLPFIFFGIICGLFLYAFMPETKGRPVDEIIDHWVIRNSDGLKETTPLIDKRKN